MTYVVAGQSDPGLPTLALVLDPAVLVRHLSGLFQRDISADIRIKVLRWKRADRCTLEIALRPLEEHVPLTIATGWIELIGKVYAEDRTDVYRTMEEIRLAGFEPDAEFGIPHAVAFLPSLRLLLYEKAPGARARKVIAASQDGDDAAHAAVQCARWLAQFHARGPRSGAVFDLNAHLTALERARRYLSVRRSPPTDGADALFGRLATAASRLGSAELRASHGTYTPGQVLLADERTLTIDWDTYQLADPAYDVARFLVELKRMGLKYTGSSDGYRTTAEAFLTAYAAVAESEVRSRLAFHEAAICLDRAQHDVEKQDPVKAQAMLREGMRLLTEDRWETH